MRKIVLIFILLLSYSAYSQEKIGTFDKVLTPLVKISNSITAPVPSINLLYGLVNHLYWNNMRIDNDSTVYATQYDINKKWAKRKLLLSTRAIRVKQKPFHEAPRFL